MNLDLKLLWNKLCIFVVKMLMFINDKLTKLLQNYRDMVEEVDRVTIVEESDEEGGEVSKHTDGGAEGEK